MGGGSSSSSSSNTTNNHNSQVSLGGDNQGLILSNVNGATIEVTDKGAIDAAFTLAGESLQHSGEALRDSISLIEHNTGQVFDLAGDSLGMVTDITEKAMSTTTTTFTSSLDAISSNLKQSLAFVNTANTPDGGLTVEIIKPLAYGSAAVAVAYLASRVLK